MTRYLYNAYSSISEENVNHLFTFYEEYNPTKVIKNLLRSVCEKEFG